MDPDASIDPTKPDTWPRHCPKCRAELTKKRQCMGHSSRTGEHCMKTAVRGAKVCGTHGGSLKRTKAAAGERNARAEVERLNIQPREISYQDALLEELYRSASWVDYLGARVMAEGEDGLTQWGMTGRSPSALWSMLEDQRKHMVVVASACGKAGIEERRVQLAEQQGKLLAQVVAQIVTGLGHDLHDEAVQGVVRPALQLVRSAA